MPPPTPRGLAAPLCCALLALAACPAVVSTTSPTDGGDAGLPDTCETGLYCLPGTLPGALPCTSQGQQLSCCPSGQVFLDGGCSLPPPPACPAHLDCARELFGSDAGLSCLSGAGAPVGCCAEDHELKDGGCAQRPPACGTGLFCSPSPLDGGHTCRDGTVDISCCRQGETFVGGNCVPPACNPSVDACVDSPAEGTTPCYLGTLVKHCCPSGQVLVDGYCMAPLAVWPNAESQANSDPWIAAHHAELRVLRPRVLAVNFVNSRTRDEMMAAMREIARGFADGSRYHGYQNPKALASLQYEIAYGVDLADRPPPAGWTRANSSVYPRENPVNGAWGFDYGQLFGAQFAQHFGITDPSQPGQFLDLCTLVNLGLVHEVWIYADDDGPTNGAEVLEMKPVYDAARVRVPGAPLSLCAGNGCFDADDPLPAHCSRSLRIGMVNHSRGLGAYLHSGGHGMEGTARSNAVPYFSRYFKRFAGMDLDTRYQTPFDSWYACPNDASTCLTYGGLTSVSYSVGWASGTLPSYLPACGNVHFPPNARAHYDELNTQPVSSTCQNFGRRNGPGGTDAPLPFDASFYLANYGTYPEGAWQVYWRQNMPGDRNPALDDNGQPMLSFWPFLFY